MASSAVIAAAPFAPVAQWIEQRFPKPLAGRSIRLGGAIGSNPSRGHGRLFPTPPIALGAVGIPRKRPIASNSERLAHALKRVKELPFEPHHLLG